MVFSCTLLFSGSKLGHLALADVLLLHRLCDLPGKNAFDSNAVCLQLSFYKRVSCHKSGEVLLSRRLFAAVGQHYEDARGATL
jgi:hypothetical protein